MTHQELEKRSNEWSVLGGDGGKGFRIPIPSRTSKPEGQNSPSPHKDSYRPKQRGLHALRSSAVLGTECSVQNFISVFDIDCSEG